MNSLGAPAVSPGRLRGYLVEDQAILRSQLMAALEEMVELRFIGSAEDESGVRHWLATGGAECDLVIVDLMLQSGSGFGVLSLLHARRAHSRLIVLSNFVNEEVRARCMALGADCVFDKSTQFDDLLDYIEQMVRVRHLQ